MKLEGACGDFREVGEARWGVGMTSFALDTCMKFSIRKCNIKSTNVNITITFEWGCVCSL